MKKLLLLAVMTAWILAGYPQLFGTHWIALPQADSTSQVWFRRQMRLPERPVVATVTIATTGKVDMYINERNVSTAIWMPARSGCDSLPVSISMEVTRFMQPGSNTIAIWYSPTFPQVNTQQIACTLTATLPSGETVILQSDKNWLARRANVSLTADGGERFDASAYMMKWNSDDIDWALWLPVCESADSSLPVKHYQAGYPAEKRNKSYTPRYFDLADDCVYYQFDRPFRGQVRLTLRNARRGEKIYIDGLQYTCSGEMDEQACQKLTASDHQRVRVWGDKDFSNEQIQTVEGIEIVPYFHESLQY